VAQLVAQLSSRALCKLSGCCSVGFQCLTAQQLGERRFVCVCGCILQPHSEELGFGFFNCSTWFAELDAAPHSYQLELFLWNCSSISQSHHFQPICCKHSTRNLSNFHEAVSATTTSRHSTTLRQGTAGWACLAAHNHADASNTRSWCCSMQQFSDAAI
jgi:hypothetical protein